MTVPRSLRLGSRSLTLDRPRLMGILNLTPDSFSDGGRFDSIASALAQARRLRDEGADLIDLGGESTRPGAEPVSLAEERRRVLPVLEACLAELDLPISVDTSKPQLMAEAIDLGAAMINDVNAFHAPGAWAAVVDHPQVALVLMHRQGTAQTMQDQPRYEAVSDEVIAFLESRAEDAQAQGIASPRLVFDPGFGFGKTLAHNLQLLHDMPRLVATLGTVLVGLSRKSMFAHLLGERPPEQRVAASVQAALLAVQGGAAILRVHDVAQTREALSLLAAVEGSA